MTDVILNDALEVLEAMEESCNQGMNIVDAMQKHLVQTTTRNNFKDRIRNTTSIRARTLLMSSIGAVNQREGEVDFEKVEQELRYRHDLMFVGWEPAQDGDGYTKTVSSVPDKVTFLSVFNDLTSGDNRSRLIRRPDNRPIEMTTVEIYIDKKSYGGLMSAAHGIDMHEKV